MPGRKGTNSMRKLDKRQKNLVILLVVVIVIAAIDFVINMDDYLGFYGSDKEKTPVEVAKAKVSEKSNTKSVFQHASAKEWGSDPFYDPANEVVKRVVKPQVKVITLTLKAISFSENMSVAMINNQVLSEGDTIEGYTVQKIELKQVTLIKDGQTKTLKLQ
jgi:hypothetical protein